MNLLVLFIILNIANVIIQTVKSIATVKCGKLMAAVANAAAYGLYTIVLVYMVCDLPLWQKVLIVAGANFIGVFVVKWIEQKLEKEKLWKIEMAIPTKFNEKFVYENLLDSRISCNYQYIGEWTIFNCYCYTKKETEFCKKICKEYNGKISAYVCAPLV